MIKRIILFKFHKNPLICRQRLQIIAHYNPGIKIYGLYGGSEADFCKHVNQLKDYLVNIYQIKGESSNWKWKHGDLAVRRWYKNIGYKIDFQVLHVIEWDLLLLDSIQRVCAKIPVQGMGLTALSKISIVQDRWMWVCKEPYRKHWQKLMKFVRTKYNYHHSPYACLGPGVVFPRKFLIRFAADRIPEYCNEEVRMALFAQCYNIKLYNTGFRKKIFCDREKKYFNCTGKEIAPRLIWAELRKNRGQRVFHPVRGLFKKKELAKLLK